MDAQAIAMPVAIEPPRRRAMLVLYEIEGTTMLRERERETMDIGETVVVGTSRLKGDKALIALLTAVPSTKTNTR